MTVTESMDVDDIDEEGATGQHQIMEFFEMCANLITTLARWAFQSWKSKKKKLLKGQQLLWMAFNYENT